MAIFNLHERTINAKIVYYGPALGGKTTSLKWVHHILDPNQEIELVSLNTDQDRTLFFDFLPISLGTIEGFRIKLQAFTVPGQVKYNKTRKYVLTGADAVVLVVDSRPDQLRANRESLLNLDENLRANGLNPEEVPLVLQYNKRDVRDALPLGDLERQLNDRGVASYATVAISGEGVFEAFTELAAQTLEGLIGRKLGSAQGHELVESLRRNLLGQLGTLHPEMRPAVPVRRATRRRISRATPLAAARELVGEEAVREEDELLRHAVASNMEVAGLLAEVREARRELGRKLEEMTALHEAGAKLAARPDEALVLDTLLDTATRGVGTEHGSLLVTRRDGRGFNVRGVRGFLEDPLAAVVHSETMVQEIAPAAGGEPVVISRESRPDVVAEMARLEAGLREVALVPVALGDERPAYLAVYRMGRGTPSLAERLPFLRALVAPVAVALESARLRARVDGTDREREATVEERTGELRAALDQLRVLDGRKDEFLSSLGHELLAPLASIRSFAEILLEHDDAEERERREFLTIIRRETDRMTGKLQDVLDLARIEAGRVSWRREAVEVRPVLNEVFDALKEKILARKVRVNLRQGRSAPRAHTDPRWLLRVLRHLLENAVQWSPAGGQIGITFREDGDRLEILVSDEGPGIPAADRERVFDRWSPGGDVTREMPAGVGLGLPLAKAVVTGLGGEIALRGEPGRGTEVRVTLPLAPRSEAAPAPGEAAGSRSPA